MRRETKPHGSDGIKPLRGCETLRVDGVDEANRHNDRPDSFRRKDPKPQKVSPSRLLICRLLVGLRSWRMDGVTGRCGQTLKWHPKDMGGRTLARVFSSVPENLRVDGAFVCLKRQRGSAQPIRLYGTRETPKFRWTTREVLCVSETIHTGPL